MTDDQQPTPTWTNPTTPPTSENGPSTVELSTAPTPPPPPRGISRRMALLWAGLGVSGAAALGSGAYALYESRATSQDDSKQGGAPVPQGDASGMPRRPRPSGAPSGFRRPGRGTSSMPSTAPTTQPS